MLSLLKSKFEIVEFYNGKFAVRKKCFLRSDVYYGKHSFYPWTEPEQVVAYCLMDTLADAENLLGFITLKTKKVHHG